jgi:hypothetical protein
MVIMGLLFPSPSLQHTFKTLTGPYQEAKIPLEALESSALRMAVIWALLTLNAHGT